MTAVVALAAPTPPASSAAAAGEEASWTAAAPPANSVFTSVQLSDGKVMAAEPCGSDLCWQLFDPLLGLWTETGLMGTPRTRPEPRGLQTLIGLPNGGALAFFYSSVDPRKFRFNGSRWVPLPPETSEGTDWTYIRSEFATTTLLDPPLCRQPVPPPFEVYPCGAVLIAGGQNNNNRSPAPKDNNGDVPYTADLYTYDPAPGSDDAGTIRPLAKMPEDAEGHLKGFTILLDDGRVLVAGGNTANSERGSGLDAGKQALFFDPAGGERHHLGHRQGAWSRADALPVATWDGQITRNSWSVRLPGPRERYLVGGVEGSNGRGQGLLVFEPAGGPIDPTTGRPMGSWDVVPNCAPDVECIGGVLRPDGTVLALAYATSTFEIDATRRAEAFLLDPAAHPDPQQWKWKPVHPDVPAGTSLRTAVLLDGAGKPQQCGTNCGLVLASGLAVAGAAGGVAQLFGTLLEVTGVSPPEGPACGGRQVTISGRGLDRVTAVNFGTDRVEAITRNPDGSITVVSPRHSPGAVPVTVSTEGGATTKASTNAIFTYTPVEPATVTGLSPKEGRADRETPVNVNGRFPAECVRRVAFGGTVATVSGPPEAGAIKATSPTGPPGTSVPVEVFFDPGPPVAATAPVASVAVPPGSNMFTYRALPAITGVPGVSAFGGPVTITGLNFEPDEKDPSPPEVSFDGVSRTATKGSATAVEVVAPPLAPGKAPRPDAPVTVETVKRGVSQPAPFAYHPGVRGIFPPSGLITGGESRTVTGAGLRNAERVVIGGQEATILERSGDGTSLVVSTPARAEPQSVPVEVVVAGLGSLEAVFFNYGDPPAGDPPAGDPDPSPPPRQTNSPQPAPPGGTGAGAPGASASPSPSPSASTSPSPSAAASPSPGASPSGVGSPAGSGAPSSSPAPGQATSPAAAGAAGTAAAPAPGPAAAPASAASGTPGAGQAGSGQAGAGGDDEREARTMPRHNMTVANVALGLGGAGAAMCFSGLALSRRRRSARNRPRPRGAY